METLYEVQIRDNRHKRAVSAPLCRLTSSDVANVAAEWEPARQSLILKLLAARVPRALWPQNLHWNFARIVHPDHNAFAIMHEHRSQGLLLVLLNPPSRHSRLPPPDQPLVYVDYVQSAWWNLRVPSGPAMSVTDPEFSGVGTRLIQHSIKYSGEHGFGGRVGLHALDDDAATFYRDHCKMVGFGPDSAYDTMEYFEFDQQRGEDFLARVS
jgi:hypothetical protein